MNEENNGAKRVFLNQNAVNYGYEISYNGYGEAAPTSVNQPTSSQQSLPSISSPSASATPDVPLSSYNYPHVYDQMSSSVTSNQSWAHRPSSSTSWQWINPQTPQPSPSQPLRDVANVSLQREMQLLRDSNVRRERSSQNRNVNYSFQNSNNFHRKSTRFARGNQVPSQFVDQTAHIRAASSNTGVPGAIIVVANWQSNALMNATTDPFVNHIPNQHNCRLPEATTIRRTDNACLEQISHNPVIMPSQQTSHWSETTTSRRSENSNLEQINHSTVSIPNQQTSQWSEITATRRPESGNLEHISHNSAVISHQQNPQWSENTIGRRIDSGNSEQVNQNSVPIPDQQDSQWSELNTTRRLEIGNSEQTRHAANSNQQNSQWSEMSITSRLETGSLEQNNHYTVMVPNQQNHPTTVTTATRRSEDGYLGAVLNALFDDAAVKKNKQNNSVSHTYPLPWNLKDAEKALNFENEFNEKIRSQSLIVKFPEVNEDVVRKCHSGIRSIHFPNPTRLQYCSIQMMENVNIDEAIKELEKIKFGHEYLKVERKSLRDQDNSMPEEIDPYTLYIGNLPEFVNVSGIKILFPTATKVDVGHSQTVRNTRYAFLRFSSVDQSIEAYKQASYLAWDTRRIVIRFRRRRADTTLFDDDQHFEAVGLQHDSSKEEILSPD